MLYAVIETDPETAEKKRVAELKWLKGKQKFEIASGSDRIQQYVDQVNATWGWNTAAPPKRIRDSVPVMERGQPKPKERAVESMENVLHRNGFLFIPKRKLGEL